MVRERREKPVERLTEVELELMSILWQQDGGATVRDVLGALPAERQLAYTSVSTVLRILEQKGVVATQKSGTRHLYVPRLSKAAYEESALRQLVTNVFTTPRSLVARLLDSDSLTQDDLKQLKDLVDARIGK